MVISQFTGIGGFEVGEVLRTANGALFGTADGGYNYGTVWKYVP